MSEETHPSTHPPLPPTTEDDRVSWLRLLRSRRVGTATFYRMLSEHGSAQAALNALPDVARAAGMQSYTACTPEWAEAEWQRARTSGARFVAITDPDYPAHLRDIPDPPPFLWAIGHLPSLTQRCIAIVGARNASSLGTRMAKSLASELAEAGFTIVSGLARGVDTAAHTATIETGTIAVLAGGVDVIYPSENMRLGEDILQNGARLSEQPIGMSPQARHFPRRNRIISGIAEAVVVVEAAAKSGSLITARNALDQGRDVLAVPGHPFDARASGCNMLLRDGATLIRNAGDVIDALPASATQAAQAELVLDTPAPQTRTLSETAALHTEILNRLGPSPLAEDQLIRDLGSAPRHVAPVLTDLEIDGHIKRDPGGLLRLAGPRHAS